MGAGKRRALGAATLAVALAALTGGCGGLAAHPGSPRPASSAPTPPATPTMTPSAVPTLGKLTLGTFPGTWGGTNALRLCEDWAGLRAEYVARLKADTPFQLEQWFSSAAWRAAFAASGALAANPGYGGISLAFGQATTSTLASIAAARHLDAACAAAD